MAKTGDLHEQKAGTSERTQFGFVLYDQGGRQRAAFSYASLDEARRGKELMDLALAHVTAELWP